MRVVISKSIGFLLLIVCSSGVLGVCQSNILPPDEEQYRRLLELIAREQHSQVIEEGKKLLKQYPRHYATYLQMAVSANASQQLPQLRAWFEGLASQEPVVPMAYTGVGITYELQQNYPTAVTYYRRCLDVLPEAEAVMVLLTRNYVLRQKKATEAQLYLKTFVAAHPDLASGYYGLGLYLGLTNQFDDALAALNRAIEINPNEPNFYYEKASTLSNAGRYLEALTALQICLQVVQREPRIDSEKAALGLLGTTYRRLGRITEASETLSRSLLVASATGDVTTEVFVLTQLGILYMRQAEYTKSLQAWQQAYALTQKNPKAGSPQRHLGSMGDIYYAIGNPTAAQQHYEEALALSIKNEDLVNQSSVLKSLGRFYTDQNELQQALSTYQQALGLAKRRQNKLIEVETLVALTDLQRQLKNFALGTEHGRAALQLARELNYIESEGDACNALGALHWQAGELGSAQEYFQTALMIPTERSSPRLIWQAHSGLAAVYEKKQQFELAREHYRKAVEVMEQVRAQLGADEQKTGFFQSKITVYERLVNVLARLAQQQPNQSYMAEAFHYAERARARTLLEALQGAVVKIEQQLDPDLLARQSALQNRLTQAEASLRALKPEDKEKLKVLGTQLNKTIEEYSAWQTEVRRRHPRLADLRYLEPLTVGQVQQLLKQK